MTTLAVVAAALVVAFVAAGGLRIRRESMELGHASPYWRVRTGPEDDQ